MGLQRARTDQSSPSVQRGTDMESSPSGRVVAPRAGRRKLWQISAHLHCSIIGTCLGLEELRQLVDKVGVKLEPPTTDHGRHGALVHAVSERKHAGRIVHRHLDRKYADCVRRFAAAQDAECLSKQWQSAIGKGDLAGSYWALLTHPLVTSPLAQRAFGEVHMLSHEAATALRRVHVELTDTREQLRVRSAELAALRGELAARSAAQHSVEMQLAEALDSVARAVRSSGQSTPSEHREDGPTEDLLRRQLSVARAAAHRARQVARDRRTRLKAAEARCQALSATTSALESDSARGHRELSLTTPQLPADAAASLPCPDLDLAGRRVAYVGGRVNLASRLRAITEHHNGEFLHHDGGLHESPTRLHAVIDRADLVLCPLDCVSHYACERLKRHCKRAGKRFMLLRSSSVSAFTDGLREAGAW